MTISVSITGKALGHKVLVCAYRNNTVCVSDGTRQDVQCQLPRNLRISQLVPSPTAARPTHRPDEVSRFMGGAQRTLWSDHGWPMTLPAGTWPAALHQSQGISHRR